MNIKEIEDKETNASWGKLEEIFDAQRTLMDNYKPILESHYKKVFGETLTIPDEVWSGSNGNLHTKLGNVLIYDMMNAAMHELSEAVQTMKNWKGWKQSEMPTDVEHWKEEMVDALHFYVEALLLAGVTAEELHNLYFKKNAVNQFRQKSNY